MQIKDCPSRLANEKGEFEIQQVVYAEDQEELIIYAKIGEAITTARQVHEVVHQVLSDSDEGYFVFLPLHTLEALQFWFMTGFHSHGHIGRIIVRREDNAHLQFDLPLDVL